MTKNTKSAIYTGVYLVLFFSMALISKQVFSIIVFSIGAILIIDLFAKILQKFFKLPRKLSILFSLLTLFVFLGLVIGLLIPTVIHEVSNFLNFLESFFNNKEWKKLFNNSFPQLEHNISDFLSGLQPKLFEFLNYVALQIPNMGQKAGSFIFYLFLLTIYGSFFFDTFKNKFLFMFPKSIRKNTRLFWKDLYIDLETFVVSTVFAALFVGGTAFVAINIIGIKYSLLLSVWAALTNFIPVVGVVFEFIPLIIVGISSGITKMLILLTVMIVIHATAFIFFLYVLKGKTRINSVAVIVSILIFGYIFGIIGPLIAVPIGILLRTYWNHFVSPYLERS